MSPHSTALDAELIGRFYAAAIDQTLWDGVATLTATAMDATSGVVKLHVGDGSVRLIDTTSNMIVPEHLRDWSDHWHTRDIWVARAAQVGPGQIITSQQLVTEEEERRSGYYQEWLRELAIFHMVGTVLPIGEGRLVAFGAHRSHDATPFTEAERGAFAKFVPHLSRALQLGERLAAADLARDVALNSLDALRAAAIIVDASCRLVHATADAQAILRLNPSIVIRAGRLTGSTPALQARIARAVHDAAVLAAGGVAAAPKSIRIDSTERSGSTMTVVPLPANSTPFAGHRPLALVWLRDPGYPPVQLEILRDLFGFTRTEALVASELARGRELSQIAAALGIKVATVRTHLKQVLLKTETRRQPEAVAVILRSAAFLPTGR